MLAADKRKVALAVAAAALCLYAGMDAPAYAHDCVGRMTNARSVGDLLAQTTIEDCMRTGYMQALVTAIVAALAGAAIAKAVAQALRTSPRSEPAGDWLQDWSLTAPNSFCDLGNRIAKWPEFQRAGSAADRTQFVFDRMREVAERYDLRPATGSPEDEKQIRYYRRSVPFVGRQTVWGGLAGAAVFGAAYALKFGWATINPLAVAAGFVVGAVIGYMSTAPRDAEDLAPLKFGKLGNCGEWAIALQTALQCADVGGSQRVAADDAPGKKFSEGHTGTYTTIMRPAPNDTRLEHPESWRFYDLYMSLSDKNHAWVGVPADQWMNNFQNKKKFIKDADGNVKAWRCACGAVNAWTAARCVKCQAASPLPLAR